MNVVEQVIKLVQEAETYRRERDSARAANGVNVQSVERLGRELADSRKRAENLTLENKELRDVLLSFEKSLTNIGFVDDGACTTWNLGNGVALGDSSRLGLAARLVNILNRFKHDYQAIRATTMQRQQENEAPLHSLRDKVSVLAGALRRIAHGGLFADQIHRLAKDALVKTNMGTGLKDDTVKTTQGTASSGFTPSEQRFVDTVKYVGTSVPSSGAGAQYAKATQSEPAPPVQPATRDIMVHNLHNVDYTYTDIHGAVWSLTPTHERGYPLLINKVSE